MKLAIDDISVPVSESQARTAPQTHPHRHRKRTTIKNDCSTAQRQAIAKANQACTKLANAAAEAALSGPVDDLQSYFKSASQSARQKVAGIYRTVTTECDKTPNGTSTPHCTDPYNNCHGDLLAYTYWQGSGRSQVGTTDYCPRYFNGAVLQAKGDQCHEQSRVTNTLHEITHALAGTSDVAYGIDGAMALSSEDVVVHADTYALFATGEWLPYWTSCRWMGTDRFAQIWTSDALEAARALRHPVPHLLIPLCHLGHLRPLLLLRRLPRAIGLRRWAFQISPVRS